MGRVTRAGGRVRSRARRSERGAALVEAAILLPLVLLIVFGALEYSSIYRDASQVSSAARAGGRIASAEPRIHSMPVDAANAVATALSSLPAQEPQEVWIFDATNSTSTPSSCGGNCIAFTWNQGTKSFDTGSYGGSSGAWINTQNACPGSSGTWARIGVYVRAKYTYLTALFGGGTRDLKSTAIFRVEPLSSQACLGS
jgi:Tfp pilus assembly protein PilX